MTGTDDRAFEAAWKACSAWDGKITKPVLRKAIAAYLREIDQDSSEAEYQRGAEEEFRSHVQELCRQRDWE